MTNSKKNSREIAVDIVQAVLEENRFSHLVLREKLEGFGNSDTDNMEKAFITRISQGTIEKKITLDYVINCYSKTNTKKMKPFILNLLRISVYQILFMNSIPDSAVCNEAVKLSKKRGFFGLSSFVNGVLRNIARGKNTIHYPDEKKEPLKAMSVQYSLPEWIIELLTAENGEDTAKGIFENLSGEDKRENESCINEEKGLSVRVNTSKCTVEEAVCCLKKENVSVLKTTLADNMLFLKDFGAVNGLEAFKKGMIQVQDISSALVGQISGAKNGDIIMDMCAAPGGKTIHLADLAGASGKVISSDISEYKTKLIEENVNRCGFSNVVIRVHDATEFEEKYRNTADIVLADVPCSGLGVLKHKSDIKYRLKKEDIKELAKISQNILTCAVQYLKSGGILLFSTCTMTKTENDDIRDWLLANFELEPVSILNDLSDDMLEIGNNRKTAEEGYLKLFLSKEYDGFFMAKFKKV